MKCDSNPCRYCPYRRDVPSGVWHPEEYAKMVEYDQETFAQPYEWFACHVQPGSACAGWLAVGLNQPHEKDLLAIRFLHVTDSIDLSAFVHDPKRYFDSGTQACVHGLKDINNPSDAAVEAIESLRRTLAKRKRRHQPNSNPPNKPGGHNE